MLIVSCSANKTSFIPTSGMEKFEVIEAVTSTRLLVSQGFKRYSVDLAYFKPDQSLCELNANKACKQLEGFVGEDIWLERNYDRYGLKMHTAWLDDPKSGIEKTYSLNLILILDGDLRVLEFIDNRNLPTQIADMISMAQDVNVNKHVHKHDERQLKPWQLRKLNGVK